MPFSEGTGVCKEGKAARKVRIAAMASLLVGSLEEVAAEKDEAEEAACLLNGGRHGTARTMVAAAVRSVGRLNIEGIVTWERHREGIRAWERMGQRLRRRQWTRRS
jgi:hypothetical protein